jgi:hypothetical protein
MRKIKKILITVFSFAVLLGVGVGINRAFHSRLFLLRKVEVARYEQNAYSSVPLDERALIRIASVPVGKATLFEVDLSSVEKRLLAQDWIQDVKLLKRFPDTIVISVRFRQPQAILQNMKGGLVYVDTSGRAFGTVSLLSLADLPVLTGFSEQVRIQQGLELLKKWEQSELNHLSGISSVHWEPEKGFRVLVTYSLKEKGGQVRTMIDLGQEIDEGLDGKFQRIANVIQYLSSKSIAVRQVWADAGKKVVVKTIGGS